MEMNEKWEKYSKQYFETQNPQDGTIPEWANKHTVDVLQTYADALEKMLKKEIAERTQAMSKLSNRVAIRAQITTLNKLLQELKSIQP